MNSSLELSHKKKKTRQPSSKNLMNNIGIKKMSLFTVGGMDATLQEKTLVSPADHNPKKKSIENES